jgi:ferredoxin
VVPTQVDLSTPAQEAREIKSIAKLFAADLVGITEIDARWHCSQRPDTRDMQPVPNGLPERLRHVIVMAHAMDFDLVGTYPSVLAGASTGREYWHEAAIVMQLVADIRNLGYQAVASMNDTALVIPYAIKAGLGEYGRNQMVLTPEFGPRVRFSKIFTILPIVSDTPRDLGLSSYCQNCTACPVACPPETLPFGAPDFGQEVAAGSVSTQRGVKKWSANCEACFGYWAKLKSDCAIRMRVCPFNRRYDRAADLIWRWMATGQAGPTGRKLPQWWDRQRGKRVRLRPRDWWARARSG